MKLPATIDDLGEEVEAIAKGVEVGAPGRSLRLRFLVYLVEQVLEIRHGRPPVRLRDV
jgi:hypothetical protein